MAIDTTGIESQIDSNLPDNNRRENKADVVRTLLKTIVRWVATSANEVLQSNTFKPFHRWTGTVLQLQNPDGTYAPGVDLKGSLAPKSVGRPNLDDTLLPLLQEIPDSSSFLYVIGDSDRKRVFGIRKDAWIEGKFKIEELHIQPGSINSAHIKASNILLSHLAQEVKSQFLAPGNVLLNHLAQEVMGMMLQSFNAGGRDFQFAIMDSMKQLALRLQNDGSLRAKFDYTDSPIKLANLSQEVKDLFIQSFNADFSKYWFAIYDQNKAIGLALTKDGWLEGRIRLMDNSVTEPMLSAALRDKINNAQLPAPFTRLNNANANDVDQDDDDYWRGVSASVDVKTDVVGYGFARFPSAPVRGLRGFNASGTTLQFRQSLSLPVRGKRYRGTFDPTSAGVVLTTYRGTYGNSYSNTYPAFSSNAVGSFWIANVSGTSSVTANGLTFKNGDLIVQTGSGTYAVQPGPGNGSFTEGDFWNVTTAGKYADLTLSAGQRLVFIGLQSASGPKYVQFITSLPGEFFLMGEVSSSSFAPVVAAQTGDLYVFGGSYTAQGIAGLEGDYLVYENGWGLVPANLKEVPANQYVALDCENANRWEVRRKDKSATVVNVSLNTFRSTLRRRANDAVVLFSDSMFGAGGIGSTIVAFLVAAGRTAVFNSYGGGTSFDILAMVKKFIRSGGDPFVARLHVFWHGQNNQTDIVQIKNAALQLASLVGLKQKKFVFWSMLGTRTPTWNGTRIVCQIHEEAFAGTNHIAQIEAWYAQMFPRQWWNPRQAALESAVGRTTPDLQFPGMTEAQVAATYGILPFSYFFNYADKPFTAAQLTFKAYWSTAALPTDGNPNEYYVRTGNGTVGAIIVNVAGTWTEYTYDVTHPTAVGGAVLAQKFTEYLTTNNL